MGALQSSRFRFRFGKLLGNIKLFLFIFFFYFSQVDISRRVTLERLPKVLILHLKRFIYSKAGSQKLQKVIDYPLELSIGKGDFRLILLLKNIYIRAVFTVCFLCYWILIFRAFTD